MSIAFLQQVQAHSNRFAAAVRRLHEHFNHNDAPATEGTSMIIANSQFVDSSALLIGDYIAVQMLQDGASPTVPNFDLPGGFGFGGFKVVEILPGSMVLVRIESFHDGAHTVLTSAENCTLSYGSQATPGTMATATRIHYRIPAANPSMLLKLIGNLRDHCITTDPFLLPIQQPPMAAPIPAAPPIDPQANMMQQFAAQQLRNQGSAKETEQKLQGFNLVLGYKRAFQPGAFNPFLLDLMLGLPGNQPPAAGWFSTGKLVAEVETRIHKFKGTIPGRNIVMAPARIEKLLLIQFRDQAKASILDFATVSESPVTFGNGREVVLRYSNLLLVDTYGLPLARAVCHAFNQLLNLRENCDAPALTILDMAALIEARLLHLPKDPSFDVTLHPDDESDPTDRLDLYFTMKAGDDDVRRVNNQRAESDKQSAAVAGGGAGGGAAPLQQPSARGRKRNASGAAAKQPPPVIPRVTRSVAAAGSPAYDQAAQKVWHDSLLVTAPALRGVILPCYHFLGKVAPCANNNQCQKVNRKQSHVVPQLVKDNLPAVEAWLKLDPMGRF